MTELTCGAESSTVAAPEREPAAKRMRRHLESVACGRGGAPISDRILSALNFARGVPADDGTCQILIDHLETISLGEHFYDYDTFCRRSDGTVCNGCCLVTNLPGAYFVALSRRNAQLHARFYANRGDTERLLGELHEPSTLDGSRCFFGAVAQTTKGLSTGLCGYCPRPSKAYCKLPWGARCARCSLVHFLQTDENVTLTDKMCKAFFHLLVAMHSEEMPYSSHYADAAIPHPIEGMERPMLDETTGGCMNLAVTKEIDATIEFHPTSSGSHAPEQQGTFHVMLLEWEMLDGRPRLEAYYHRPGTIHGLQELLSEVRLAARDLRKRGPCPECGYQMRVLTAEFCAGCCLEAIARGA